MAANITVTPILRNTYLGSNNGRQSIIIHMTDLQTTEKIRALCKNVRIPLPSLRATKI